MLMATYQAICEETELSFLTRMEQEPVPRSKNGVSKTHYPAQYAQF